MKANRSMDTTTTTITECSSRIPPLRCVSVKEKELTDYKQLDTTNSSINSPVSITSTSHFKGFSSSSTFVRSAATVIPPPPGLYSNQVGGHGSILTSAPGRILKPSNDKERLFYESVSSSFSATTSSARVPSELCSSTSQDSQQQQHVLRAHIPVYYGTHSRHNNLESNRAPKASGGATRWIELQDVNAALHTPCILDLKIGTRHYDNDASPEKVARTKEVALTTTTAATGLRLIGMRFTDPVTGVTTMVDKQYGKRLQADELGFQLERFFHLDSTDTMTDDCHRGCNINRERYEQQSHQHQGNRKICKDARIRVVKCVLDKVERILAAMTRIDDWNFYSSSLLIVYDAHASKTGTVSDVDAEVQKSLVVVPTASSSKSDFASGTPLPASHGVDHASEAGDIATLTDVKMIDFAHTVRCQTEETRDDGYVFGLVNLRSLLRGIIEKHEQVTG